MGHADGYDKLQPFDLALSRFFDTLSQNVLWLQCGPTGKKQYNLDDVDSTKIIKNIHCLTQTWFCLFYIINVFMKDVTDQPYKYPN